MSSIRTCYSWYVVVNVKKNTFPLYAAA